MMAPAFETAALLTPGRLGPYTLPHRVLMAPMTRNRARRDGVPSTSAVIHYAQRASAGMIVTETTTVSELLLMACSSLFVVMLVAVYVHLQPGVPADVLPLGIKPAVMPLFVLVLDILVAIPAWRSSQTDELRFMFRGEQTAQHHRAVGP